ncbi:MAG: hypothetical protein HQL08_11485 [Nitrospirae bacterium]|nr:hypothetical protein [Nitrospirota bacterium]
MKHKHKFETLSHPGITSEIMEHGIQAAEIRKCESCDKQTIFLMTRHGHWVPLFDETESGANDILLS